MSTYNMVIVTPEKMIFEGEVSNTIVRTIQGDVGVLKGHIGYVAPLDTGLLKLTIDGTEKKAAISGGILRVSKEKTTILTNTFEWADDIDVTRATASKEKALDRINKKEGDLDRAELRLRRALNRLSVAGEKE